MLAERLPSVDVTKDFRASWRDSDCAQNERWYAGQEVQAGTDGHTLRQIVLK